MAQAHTTQTFGPVGIALASGSGTGINGRLMLLSQYTEAYLMTAYIVLPASQGPIWGYCVLRTGGQTVVLSPPAWIRGDPNFGGSDFWYFIGQLGISPLGGNELIPLLRNDSGATVTAAVGGTLLIVRD